MREEIKRKNSSRWDGILGAVLVVCILLLPEIIPALTGGGASAGAAAAGGAAAGGTAAGGAAGGAAFGTALSPTSGGGARLVVFGTF